MNEPLNKEEYANLRTEVREEPWMLLLSPIYIIKRLLATIDQRDERIKELEEALEILMKSNRDRIMRGE